MDVAVHATKRDMVGARIAWVGPPPDFLADYAWRINGKDPQDVLRTIPDAIQRIPAPLRVLAMDWFVSLRRACLHCQNVRVMARPSLEQRHEQSDGGTIVADLYQNDFQVIVTP